MATLPCYAERFDEHFVAIYPSLGLARQAWETCYFASSGIPRGRHHTATVTTVMGVWLHLVPTTAIRITT